MIELNSLVSTNPRVWDTLKERAKERGLRFKLSENDVESERMINVSCTKGIFPHKFDTWGEGQLIKDVYKESYVLKDIVYKLRLDDFEADSYKSVKSALEAGHPFIASGWAIHMPQVATNCVMASTHNNTSDFPLVLRGHIDDYGYFECIPAYMEMF